MKKVSKPGRAKKVLAQKKPAAKVAKPQKAQGGSALAETVAQLSRATEKLARSADKLAEAAARLSASTEARKESAETRSRAISDPMPRQEPEAAGDLAAQEE
jgi:hypothetical protein